MSVSDQTDGQYFSRDIPLDSTDNDMDVVLTVDQRCMGDVGCVVWDAALLLAKYLDHQRHRLAPLADRVVVELGSGTGFCGLTAAALGSRRVLITDLADCVDLMARNVDRNRHLVADRVTVKEFNWSETDPNNPYFFDTAIQDIDYILVSDCLYYEQSVQHLYDTIEWLSSKGATVLLSYEDRDDKQPLVDKFFKLIGNKFTVNEIQSQELHPDYRSPDLHLFQLIQNL